MVLAQHRWWVRIIFFQGERVAFSAKSLHICCCATTIRGGIFHFSQRKKEKRTVGAWENIF